jgi:hypothetical protein
VSSGGIAVGLFALLAWAPQRAAGGEIDCDGRRLVLDLAGGTLRTASVCTPAPTTCGTGADLSPNCPQIPPQPGEDDVWTVSIPESTALTIDIIVVPEVDWDPGLYLLREEGTNCLAGVDAGFLGSQEVLFDVTIDSGADTTLTTLRLVIDSASVSPTYGCGVYSLEVHWAPLSAEGDNCATAVPLVLSDSAPVTFIGSTCGLSHDSFGLVDGDCGGDVEDPGMFQGRDAVFAITVEPDTTWSVQLTPVGMWDVALALSSSCESFRVACLRAADEWRNGQAEALTGLDNPAPGITYFLLVDTAAGTVDECGSFRLEARLGDGVTPVQETSWGRVKATYRHAIP